MNRTRKKREDCKVFLMCTLLVLLLPFGFLFFSSPAKFSMQSECGSTGRGAKELAGNRRFR